MSSGSGSVGRRSNDGSNDGRGVWSVLLASQLLLELTIMYAKKSTYCLDALARR